MSDMSEDHSISPTNKMKKEESNKSYGHRDVVSGSDLWRDGLICAFEFIRGRRRSMNSKSTSKILSRQIGGESSNTQVVSEVSSPRLDRNTLLESLAVTELRGDQIAPNDDYKDSPSNQSGQYHTVERLEYGHWVPIGWARISELVQTVQIDAHWATQQLELMDDDDGLTVADLAAPYWERPAGPIWWCHVAAGHPSVQAWLNNAKWLHPAISLALRDESRLISERMKHLLYEVDSLFHICTC